jgi:hypothetical protein
LRFFSQLFQNSVKNTLERSSDVKPKLKILYFWTPFFDLMEKDHRDFSIAHFSLASFLHSGSANIYNLIVGCMGY